jgi:hypothetical protein
MGDDNERPGQDACASQPLDGTTNNQCDRGGDAAQIRLPISKRARAAREDALTLKEVSILPYSGWKADKVGRYALPYHAMSSVELK